MNTTDGVPIGSFQTRPENPIHLLLHLSISPLDRPQISVTAVVPLNLQPQKHLEMSKIMPLMVPMGFTVTSLLEQKTPLLLLNRCDTLVLRSSPPPSLIEAAAKFESFYVRKL